MKKKTTKPPFTVTTPDHGDPWINNLAILLRVFDNMEDREVPVQLDYLNARYGRQ